MYVTGTIIISALLLTAILFLRLRARFETGRGRRILFVGLGRSGLELDFTERAQVIRLFGWRLKSRSMKGADEPEESKTKVPRNHRKKSKRKRPGRARPVREILAALPATSAALWHYSLGLLKSLSLEEMEAEIDGGFDAVDLTGQVYGFYQAALAAAPGMMGRIHYTPDWTGASFNGKARVAVALPLYRLAICTVKLIFQLPLRQLVKLAIGKKRGGQDG